MTGTSPIDDDTSQTTTAIPKAWEDTRAPIQLNLVDSDTELSSLTPDERETLCHSLLGDLRRTYRHLIQQATRVRERVMADSLQGDSAIMSRPHAGDPETARAMALAAITDWFYQDGQGEKETSVYMGAVASSHETIGAIIELNRLKEQFSEGMSKIRALLADEDSATELNAIYAALAPNNPLNVRRKVVGTMVRNCIHPRLNIRQLVRHVPVVPVCPDRMRWKWTRTPSTIRITRDTLMEILESKQDIAARFDLEAVAGCPDPEYSWEKGISEDCRIGVFCKSAALSEDSDWTAKNTSLKGRLPLFYLSPRLAPYIRNPKPRKNLATHKLKPQMVMAEDVKEPCQRKGKLEKQSFLQSMTVRRYLKYSTEQHPSASHGVLQPHPPA